MSFLNTRALVVVLNLWLVASLASYSLCARAADSAPTVIAFLGDSLTEGYGVPSQSAYPKLIEKQLQSRGRNVLVHNVSISGSTSASAPARMKKLLEKKPAIVVLALGANDALRGLKPAAMQANLSKAVETAQAAKVKVILAALKIPSPYGPKYSREFEAVYSSLKKKYDMESVPDFLKGVFGKPEFNQDDGLHPNERGHQKMAETMIPILEKVLEKRS